MSHDNAPVFHDPGGRRWPWLRRVLYVLAATTALVLTLFVASVLSNPFLPQLKLPQTSGLPKSIQVRPPPPPHRETPPPTAVARAVTALRKAEKHAPAPPGKRPQLMKVAPAPFTHPPVPTGRPIAAGFYVNWDDSSYASLRRNLAALDWVIPEWARLESDLTKRAATPLKIEIDPRALDLVRRERPQARILPLVQNYHDQSWDAKLVEAALADEQSRSALVRTLADLVGKNGFGGAVIDFEEVAPATQPAYLDFLKALHVAFAPHGWIVGEAVPFDDEEWGYPAHAAVTDYLFLMAYDQHWSSSAPGPVAAQDWFEHHLADRLNELDPARTMLCVGGYGYNWAEGEKTAEVVSFQEAVRSAHDSGGSVRFDAASKNPVVRYDDEDGTHHQVWFLDAVTAHNQMEIAARRHVAGYALWRLGVEDPSLWTIYGHAPDGPESHVALRQINYPYDVDFEGTGELLEVGAEPQAGTRELIADAATGLITSERYTALPASYQIRRSGARPGFVALTFDDGPDRLYTPAILDILRQDNVHATFFIIGEKGAESPDLVRRVAAEGHDLGNHTYTHPNLGEASALVTDLELNATQRLIESLTGRATTLFRPPYFGDAEPQTPDEVEPIVRARRLGYLAVGLRIDPDDWAMPGTDEIVRRTLAGASTTDEEKVGNIVLLHDGGGDRRQTVEALPRIIAGLRQAGLKIVPVSELAGLTRDQAMPPVGRAERVYRYSDSLFFFVVTMIGWFLRWLFLLGLALGFARMALVALLAFIQRLRRRHGGGEVQASRTISVVIAAYNEEKVIVRTIESLLSSTYPNFEIVVIDDGSKDGTYRLVMEQFAGEPRVRAFTKPNGGKAEALNFGLERATGEIIVALDADTLFPPEVLAELARPFADLRVGAVAGNAKVGNRINLVTRWQALEYIASQNLDRRAFDLLNCITVVPGAVGAWRRDVLEELGGFASDTLAEDQDLTLKVRRLGYRIAYAEGAIAYTEAPDTLRVLAKQRFRWSFGTLQCLWKHRGALFRPSQGTLGWIAMPNVWLFQILFPLFAPLVDLLLVGALGWALLERIEHPAAGALRQLEPVLFYYALFLAVDWASSALAFLLEKGEEWSLLGWFLLQRVCYRQIMYYVMLKSIYMAFRGGLVGWGTLERKATVAQRG